MTGHIDRWVMFDDRIVEIKCARVGQGWGEPGTDEIPLHYLAQVHHYLVLAEVPVCDVVVLIGGSDFRIYTVEADPVVAEGLVEQELAFAQRVMDGTPPEPVNLADAVRRWGKSSAEGFVEATQRELAAVEVLRLVQENRRITDETEEFNKAVILRRLGDSGDSLIDDTGKLLATWKLDRGVRGYTVAPREPARRFLLKD